MSDLLVGGPIDLHSHILPPELPRDVAGETQWPCMQRHSPVSATLMIAEKPFRELDDRSWDGERRIRDMDRDGIGVQVLSPMPELLSYWFNPKAADHFADYVNADVARQVAQAPSRFLGLGTIPMQDPDMALRHLERIKCVHGLAGVEVGSNVNGEMLGSPVLAPIFAAIEDLDLPVFVHALHPVATRGVDEHAAFTPMVGFPLDIAMAAASIIMSDLMDRHPRLRIGFSHGGGALAPVLHRMDFTWGVTEGFAGTMAERPSTSAARFYIDSNVYDPGYLRYLATQAFAGRVFLGTDYPYAIMQPDPVRFVSDTRLEPDVERSVLRDAAVGFLDLSQQ